MGAELCAGETLQVGREEKKPLSFPSFPFYFDIDALLTNAAMTFRGGEILTRRQARRQEGNGQSRFYINAAAMLPFLHSTASLRRFPENACVRACRARRTPIAIGGRLAEAPQVLLCGLGGNSIETKKVPSKMPPK